jgi:peptide/nickel transport system substrate-binding protein
MSRQIRLLICFQLFVLALLAACSDQQTPTPMGPAPTAAASPTASPVITSTNSASSTITRPTGTATTTQASTSAVVNTAVPTPRPTVTLPATTSSQVFPTPSITPLPIVPLQPVRRTGGTLTVGVLDGDFKARNFSPYAADLSEVSQRLQTLTWNAGLLYRDPVKLEWKPLAARALPVAENEGRKLTFQLRQDIFWSDGSPILASDYIYAFNSALKETRYPHLAELRRIRSVEGPDTRTLVFTFDDRYATAFDTIRLIEPLPEKVWGRYPFNNPERNPEISRPTVVSGPYLPDPTALIYQGQLNYFMGRPNFDKVSLILAGSPADLLTGLKAGSLGWTFFGLSPASINDLQVFSSVTIYRWTPQDAGQRYIGYNLSNPFLRNPAVRQALNRTVDVRSLIATVEKGQAVEQTSFLPAASEFAIKVAPTGRFSLRQAQEDLKNSGYYPRDLDDALSDSAGKVVPALELIYPDNIPESASIAVYLQQQYMQLGLKVKTTRLDQANYLKRRAEGKYDLEVGLLRVPGASDPDNFKAQFTSQGSLNFSGYSSDTVDALFSQALRLSDVEQKSQRRLLYEQLQRLIANDSPVFFLYTLQSSTVMGSSIDPGGGGVINLPRWQLAWDAFPALLNWYQRGAA